MSDSEYYDEAEALLEITKILRKVDPSALPKLHQMIAIAFGLTGSNGILSTRQASNQSNVDESHYSRSDSKPGSFSADRSPTPKAFIMEKKPQSGVERVACLAYYLTHFRDTPHFKTADISMLNTEAAQLKFPNAAQAVNDATKQNYIHSVSKGQKQLSAIGELFVEALPDRDAAKIAMREAQPKKKKKKVVMPKTPVTESLNV